MRRLVRQRLAFVLAAAIAGTAGAQAEPRDSVLEAATTVLAAGLRCPVCKGLSMQDSPSGLAQQMRGLIRDQLRSGKTPAEVTQYFVDKYGEWILLAPKPEGFNLLVYLIPVYAVLAGAGIIWRVVGNGRRRRRRFPHRARIPSLTLRLDRASARGRRVRTWGRVPTLRTIRVRPIPRLSLPRDVAPQVRRRRPGTAADGRRT